jgi:PPOX class probable F420-dependent enzyme
VNGDDRLALVKHHAAADRHLGVLITSPGPQDPQVSVVNAAVVPHPVTGEEVIALVARGRTAKLVNLRRRPRATILFRDGWEWVAARGPVELAGPDDPLPGVDDDARRILLRTIYAAAGGDHPDLEEYDRAMRDERRCAVLIAPERIWSNPPGSEHQEPT